MSTGLDELIDAIEDAVGLDEGDTRDDLSLDWQYACACGAEAIRVLQKKIEALEINLALIS